MPGTDDKQEHQARGATSNTAAVPRTLPRKFQVRDRHQRSFAGLFNQAIRAHEGSVVNGAGAPWSPTPSRFLLDGLLATNSVPTGSAVVAMTMGFRSLHFLQGLSRWSLQ
jgi:hypothetical protein